MAVDWIETQLKSYGCPTDRISNDTQPNPQQTNAGRGERQARQDAAGAATCRRAAAASKACVRAPASTPIRWRSLTRSFAR